MESILEVKMCCLCAESIANLAKVVLFLWKPGLSAHAIENYISENSEWLVV